MGAVNETKFAPEGTGSETLAPLALLVCTETCAVGVIDAPCREIVTLPVFVPVLLYAQVNEPPSFVTTEPPEPHE